VKLRDLAQRVVGVAALALVGGCSQNDVVAELRSLSGSEDAVFLCRDSAGNGHPYSDCPDRDTSDDADPAKKLSVFSLVTQTVTDEVAVVNVTDGHVVDVDPSLPGYGFLRVGGRPVSIATTPGGEASFVATADVGRNGLFALPTRCLQAPTTGRRELTSWPACRLDETPGEMTVLLQPTDGESPEGCNVEPTAAISDPGSDVCWADLTAEGDKPGGVKGRRKLVVAFPDSGKLRVYDAQDLLDRHPAGTFSACEAERTFDLKVDVPQGVAQTLPSDLETMCSEVAAPTAPPPAKRGPQPAGFAVSEDRLYIADQTAPVIHVLDTSRVCELTELPSLLPMSLREPWRTVTTRRVAVSPLTPAGQRFVYAIDSEDQPGASVMAFDVSPGSTAPTPIVRPGSPELPGEKPDRLAIGVSSARDVTFAYRDIPYVDEATGAAQFGVRCDPDPDATVGPATLARPNADYSIGARPGLLRGLFGFVLLTDGRIAVIDVDDFDAACRRPVAVNPSSTPDFRGCANDPKLASGFIDDKGIRTVTDEVSCRVIEPHRPRSVRLSVNSSTVGTYAPSLRSLPQLSVPASAVTSSSEDRARMLAVPYAGAAGAVIPADVYLGSTLYSTDGGSGDQLPTDPNDTRSPELETLNGVVLPPLEPRSYAAADTVTVTYEGAYAPTLSNTAFLAIDESDEPNRGVFTDASRSFCGVGVYDVATMTDYAATELRLGEKDAAAFGVAHADYVQLLTGYIDEKDSWWAGAGRKSRQDCIELFGDEKAETLPQARDLSIVSAFADHLVLAPRDPNVTMKDVHDCFPGSQSYQLRASKQWVLVHKSTGFRHDVVEAADRSCVRSCDPLKKWQKGRVFEISSSSCRKPAKAGEEATGDPFQERVGCAEKGEVACVYDQATGGVQLGGPASECIFDGLNERFALYRGRVESVRDAAFSFATTGGFTPLVMNLASISTNVSPQQIQYLRQAEQLAIVDGSSQGLSMFSLDTFTVVAPSPFY